MIVLDSDDLKAAEIALIENVQRADLNPVEEAFGYHRLIEQFGLTQEQGRQPSRAKAGRR